MNAGSHVAHVWVDDFFVAVERQADATLRDRPVVVGGSADSPGRVVAASIEAMACGVVPGVRLRDAGNLCPDAAFLPGRLDRVLDAASLVDETIRMVAGPVEWLAVDEAVLDLAQLDRVRARRVAERIREAIGALGYAAAVGVADTRTAARVAARMARPHGMLVVLPGYDGRFLSGLAPACLGEIDPPTLDTLAGAGIDTLGTLAALSPQEAFALLGQPGPQLARRAAGEDVRRVRPTPRPARLCRVHRFESDATPAQAAHAGEALVEDLARALARFGCVARGIGVRVEDARGAAAARTVDVTPASGLSQALMRVAVPLVTRLAAASPVRRLVVSAVQLSADREQLALFREVPPRAAVGFGGLPRAGSTGRSPRW